MEAIDAINNRCSVRKYINKAISIELIDKIIEAGMNAPSANNSQPWEFVVVDDKNLLDKISSLSKYTYMVKDAGIAIIVCGDSNKSKDYWVQDCSACTENILLACHSLGLGAVWCGVYPREERANELKELFRLPDNLIPLNIISIGYPESIQIKKSRFDRSRMHFNKF